MIITEKYAKKLVGQGKATLETTCVHDGKRYQTVARHDRLRVDHYLIEADDD